MQIAEHHREQFELAYATAWAKDRNGDETPEQLAAEIKSWRIGDTYGEDLPSLRFGWEGYQWARASQCLAQVEEPAQPVLYVSPGQLANHSNPEGPESAKAGRYLPARKTPAGKFTQPLYAGAAPAAVAGPAARKVFLVATGETSYGAETYTRHDDAPPPLCDAECLYTAPAAPALEAPAHQCCNSWFLSLPEDRQAVLRENQWMLADAAYQAGRESRSALEAPAAETIAQAITDNFRDAGWSMPSIDAARVLEAVKSALGPAAAPQAPAAPAPMAWPVVRDELLRWAQFADQATRMNPRDARNNMETLAEELTKLVAMVPVPALDASVETLITAVRLLPMVRCSEIDGEESDGTPKRWRNRPFVSRTALERLLRKHAAAPAAPAVDARDAALWREHVEKLDALIAYCPTCSQGYIATAEMTRDQIIFECGKTAGRAEGKPGAEAAPAAPEADDDPLGLRDVGEALVKTIAENSAALDAAGWTGPMDCPSEIVVDLLNLLEEANTTSALGEWVATLEVDSEGGLDYETVPPCTLPPGCYPLYRAAQAKEGGAA